MFLGWDPGWSKWRIPDPWPISKTSFGSKMLLLTFDRKLVAILVSGLAVMGFTVWIVASARAPEIPMKERRYMHCVECGKEMRYEDKRPTTRIARTVGRKVRGWQRPTRSARRVFHPPCPNARAALIIEVTILAGVVYWYASRRLHQVNEERELYMECGHCHQRLRYTPSQIGRWGQCPRCKRRFMFSDAVSDEEAPLHWWQPQWWRPDSGGKCSRKAPEVRLDTRATGESSSPRFSVTGARGKVEKTNLVGGTGKNPFKA